MEEERTNAIIGIAVIVMLVIAGAALWNTMDGDTPQESTGSLTLGVYAGDTSSLVYIAHEQGFFGAHRLNVTLREYNSGKAAYDALLTGDVDVATATEFVYVSNSFAHHNLSIMGSIAITDEMNKLVARRDHGITAPDDLAGMTIGVTEKSAAEFYLGTFLLFNNLSLHDVTVVDLTPGQIVENLSNGGIDAALTWEPNVYHVQQQLGSDAITWPAQSDQDFYFVLASHDAWIANHAAIAEQLLAALVDAEQYVASHEHEARRYIREYFNNTEAYLDVVWPIQRFRVTLPQALLLAMEQEAGWLIEQGLVSATAIPNYYDDIYQQGLRAVQPDAVTILGGKR
jgi:NitT/TauT family transport system substrate-binding protein